MELFSASFLSALLAIVVIDLVLAGDNAIVIALAARKLPPQLQRRAVMWGAMGAVAVRSVMTLGVVWLLGIPGLRFAGGALLLWIAYKLLTPNENAHGDVAPATTFWGAMKTIIVADAVMGIDNVLAVAGAAHGSYLLVVLGLLISIPIVMWGSSLILRYTERFPFIIYLGAAVLVLTGVKMMLAEPAVAQALAGASMLKSALYAGLTATLLLAGHRANTTQRLRSALRQHAPLRRRFRSSLSGGNAMTSKVLLPVDGSENALHAVREFLRDYRAGSAQQVVLLNVQPRFNRHIAQFVAKPNLTQYQQQQAHAATGKAAALLEQAQVPFESVMGIGARAEVIADVAKRHACSRILLATARKHSLTRLFENSVTAKLLEIAPVPVQIVVGPHASRWERFGVPAGIGAAVAALVLAD